MKPTDNETGYDNGIAFTGYQRPNTNEKPREEGIEFTGFQVNNPRIIKVIGVGGGGGNAVNHMYNEGVHDVTYVVCNTDNKALSDSPVPNKLQLGSEGLGAGNRPERAREKALESIEDIDRMLDDNTRMVFITAGMGGGTGTGAAPVIAERARQKDILTVGIVTIPFMFEGRKKIDQALDGVEELSKHVDALLVINNERLRSVYPELTVINAFAKADDTLSVAARSIADIITMRGILNLDFEDVKTVLKNGGVAVMSTGYAEGENRVTKAIEQALNSPLLNNQDIFNSKKVLLNINFAAEKEGDEMRMEEMNEVHEFMSKFRDDVEVKWGMATDASLKSKLKITLLATGFGLQSVPGMKPVLDERQEAENAMLEEERQEKDDRAKKFYDNLNGISARKSVYIFHFQPNDLDNDDIISLVETTPTYKRTSEGLKLIKSKSEENKSTPQPAPSVSESNTITF